MGNRIQQAVGLGAPFVKVFPVPVIAQRAPSDTTDLEYPQGQLWFDNSVDPVQGYVFNGSVWNAGGDNPATTTTYGTVLLTDNNEPVATKFYADALAIAGSPVSTETTAGIGQLATDAEAVARDPSSGALALFLTPSNLDPILASPSAIGSTAPSTGAFTDLTITGTVSISSAAPITIDVTGAGNDLTLSSDAGRVIVNGEEAAANAVTIVSAAGGIDVDAALQINIATSQRAVDAIRIVASAGGIDIDAVGTAGEDINITNTGASVVIVATESAADAIVINATLGGIDILASGAGAGEDIDIIATGSSVNIKSTENNAGAIIVQADAGTSERVTLLSSQGTGADSINLESTAGGITLSAALASADAINLSASAGGVDIDGALQVNIASSQNAADAIRIIASAGGIDVDAVGAAAEDINITNTGGSVVIVATESAADAIRMNASGAAGGFDIDAGSNGFIVDTTGAVSLDAAAASNLTVTGAFALDVISTLGKVTVSSGQNAADSVVITSLIGGIDILAAGAGAGEDIDIVATGSSVNISATENDAGAITVGTNGGTSERITVTCAQGTNAASIALTSTAGGLTFTGGLATADAINIVASNAAGGIDVDAGTNGVIVDTTGAISLDSAAASNFTVTGAFDLSLISSAGSVNITAGEDAADAIVLSAGAGGIDILATGAAAQDIDIVNTGGSVNITATENISSAVVITASGAAAGMTLSAGTTGITLSSGILNKITSVATAATPYAVLGTDSVISTNSTAGALEITLPAVPVLGRTLVVYDGTGQAAAGGNVTINGNGVNIAAAGTSAGTKVLNTAYESYTLYYNGTIWMGQNIV